MIMDDRMKEQIKETVSYMKGMNEYARQEITRYVRGVYDGAESVKRQYGLEEPPKDAAWNGHPIRFVEKGGEWWAVADDVAAALGYGHTPHMVRMIDDDLCDVHKVDTTSDKKKARKTQEMTIISEAGIYQAIFNSQREEAKAFRKWVCGIIKKIREEVLGLKSYEAFRLMNTEHQKGLCSACVKACVNR
jgi:prophage antirepressor-like protein